jgi:hypothetical protein
LASGNYLNVPVTFTNVVFDTSDGNININSGQVTTANTTYTLGGTYSGTNKIRFNFNFNFRVSTTIASNNIVNAGTGTLTFVPVTGTITVSGAPVGSRATLFYANGAVAQTAVTATTTHAFTNAEALNTTMTLRIYSVGRRPISQSVTTTAQGVNSYTVNMTASDGYQPTALTLRNLNGTQQNAGGVVSINFTNNTITFDAATDLRDGLSVLAREWTQAAIGGTYNIDQPFDLDSVKGISIAENWSIVNENNTRNEGWIEFAAAGALEEVNYRLVTENNDHDIIYTLITNGVSGNAVTLTGQQNTIIPISTTAANVSIRTQIKHQLIDFIDRTEDIRINGGSYQRFYQNEVTNYLETPDTAITVALPQDDTKYRMLVANVTVADDNNLSHTFTRVIEVEPGTVTRQSLLNQFAAIATFNSFFSDKFFSLGTDGKVTLTQGFWVRQRDGTALSGTLLALLNLSSTAGNYIQPQTRVITVSRHPDATLSTNFVIVDTGTSTIVTDAGGNPCQGVLDANNTNYVFSIRQNTDRNVTIRSMSNVSSYASENGTLVAGGVTFNVLPASPEVVAPVITQTTDDSTTGVVRWDDVITTATFDTTNRRIVIPTQVVNGSVVKSYNAVYFYHAWRNWVNTDYTRLRHGQAVFAEHQLKPPGSTNNAYQLKPGVYMNDNWALDVVANRLTTDIIRLEASALGRLDSANRSGLVYVSPLANGSNSMAEVIIAGAATQSIAETYTTALNNAEALSKLRNSLGWLMTNGKLLGLKPFPTQFDPDTDYRDNLGS